MKLRVVDMSSWVKSSILAYDCYIDSYDLVRLLKENIENEQIKSKCDAVLIKINQTVPFHQQNPNASNCGLSIYFPGRKFMYNKYKFKGEIPLPYEGLKFSEDTYWDEFLIKFLTAKKYKSNFVISSNYYSFRRFGLL